MNNFNKVISLLVFFYTQLIFSQVEIEWTYTYDYIGWWENTKDIAMDNSGNIFITGESTRTNNPQTNYDYATIKLNAGGEQMWVKRFNTGINDYVKAITTDNDGNVYVTGQSEGIAEVIKYDTDGHEIWTSGMLNGNPIDIATDDSGYIYITGEKYYDDFFLFKYDGTGKVIWHRYINSTFLEHVLITKLTLHKNRILLTGTSHTDSTDDDGLLLAYDNNGILLWENTYNGKFNDQDRFFSISIDTNNSILVTGIMRDTLWNTKMFTAKYSWDGKLEWGNAFDQNDYDEVGNVVLADSNNNVYVGGYVEEVISNVVYRRCALVKYDQEGKFLWFKDLPPDTLDDSKIEYMSLDYEANIYCIGRYKHDSYYRIQVAKFSSDGELLYKFIYPANDKLAEPSGLIVQSPDEFLVCGYIYGVVPSSDYLVLKYIVPTSVLDQNIVINKFKLEQNYPNPFNPTTKIGFRIAIFGLVTLKVYDVLGEEIVTLVNEQKPAGTYEVEFDASSLPSGVYFYQLKTGNFIKTKKMILLK